jgi:hypothetical protein
MKERTHEQARFKERECKGANLLRLFARSEESVLQAVSEAQETLCS